MLNRRCTISPDRRWPGQRPGRSMEGEDIREENIPAGVRSIITGKR